ncbi:MAG: UDP-N-acetylmuramate--L-alanine ligase [Clostridia bacterium]|nr:UDP-N-acetylmuramate--L-alanine ligase [Clostridia bacterium]
MRKYFCMKNYNSLHVVGVGGVSMSGLAHYSIMENKYVSGSDETSGDYFKRVLDAGGKVYIGERPSCVKKADAVIVSSAISSENKEIKKCIKRGIPIFKRSEMLGGIISEFENSVAVSGSHGKTTTTAMIASIMREACFSPTVFCGGDDLSFGNFLYGDKKYVVTEACEYNKNLLDLKAKISVVLNIDNDHLESYRDMSDMIETFKTFSKESITVYNADDYNASLVANSSSVSYGIQKLASYSAENVKKTQDGYSFSLKVYGRKIGRITLKVAGRHNVYNALAAIAVSDILGISFSTVKRALESFKGVKRRNEFIGAVEGCKFFADYAHHPREIALTVKTFLEDREKFFTVFQPHTYSRTKLLMNDFINVLKDVEDLILFRTYAAREKYDQEGDAAALYKKLVDAGKNDVVLVSSSQNLFMELNKRAKEYQKCLVLGAGDIYNTVSCFFA